MPEHDGLLRIFWPLDLSKSDSPGILVGWRNSGLDLFVVSILEGLDIGRVYDSLKAGALDRNVSHPLSRIFELCGKSSMQVLGVANSLDTEVENLQIHVITSPGNELPQVFCARASTIQIIVFERPLPNKMQYVSLDPISLALDDKAGIEIQSPGADPIDQDLEEIKSWKKAQNLVEKIKLHTVTKHPATAKERALLQIINQINSSLELDRILQKNNSSGKECCRRSLSVSERVFESAISLRDIFITAIWKLVNLYIYPVIKRLFVIILLCHRILAEALLLVLEWRIKPDYAALKDISATAQQLDIRLQQFCYWPMQYVMLRKRKNDWESVTTSHPDYIRFYNSLWLVANDVIIGFALGSYIIDNAAWVTEYISRILSMYSIAALQNAISWLMDWPAGLKLNNELAAFLGDLFLWVIDYWSNCFEKLRPILPHVIWLIGFSSYAGASMPISLLSDLISILTLHIYCFYMASARIYNWQYIILLSLFQLFRGKKHNVLRKRIDSCDYDLDQLLLGTILFTLLFFLLPTVLVFYFTFASFRMAIISLKAILDTLLACLNHFPLFALMLRLKDSRRLPGGICFELREPEPVIQNSTWASSELKYRLTTSILTSYIHLKSVPLTFRAMFHQYFQLGHRIRKHYLSPRVLLCLVTGRFIPPIHRKNLYSLQYTMLPARRTGILEMWNILTENDQQKKSFTGSESKFNGKRQTLHSYGRRL
ncbi:N-acetylglucosaminyl-phosphatidylinositol biosynthetic protein gpi1 [Golovinomyces cichoracearum]|uniref:N-acetylglucosaminyl-phosphatidylinositol biosynthetic protein gpi1 n=1 Tax=Golovinomyces cichoracearum TaxID=62708 RepID=A0A420HN90_9PEZI|nr:N-acetylglucosaminyl-phosphatidylinositol biosynthetic protein gpi1 [Golovinomyces cichoracearum]